MLQEFKFLFSGQLPPLIVLQYIRRYTNSKPMATKEWEKKANYKKSKLRLGRMGW
jgi:hypothetical protein